MRRLWARSFFPQDQSRNHLGGNHKKRKKASFEAGNTVRISYDPNSFLVEEIRTTLRKIVPIINKVVKVKANVRDNMVVIAKVLGKDNSRASNNRVSVGTIHSYQRQGTSMLHTMHKFIVYSTWAVLFDRANLCSNSTTIG